jgi:hypothetical protein
MTLSGTMHTETSVSEPLMKYRKLIRRCQNQGSHPFPGISAWRLPMSWPSGCVKNVFQTRCCMRDDGRPIGAALWEEASNCRKRLRSKGVVVNVSVKRRNKYVKCELERRAQANLWLKHRKPGSDDIKTGEYAFPRDKCERNPFTVRTVSGAEEASLQLWLLYGT